MESKEKKPSGGEMLKSLEAENRYVFHGSDNQGISELEPRQAYTKMKDVDVQDDKPAVHASPLADVAIFMSLFNEKNCPEGFKSQFSYQNGLSLSTTQSSLDQLNPDSRGYVYVFNKDNFISRGPSQALTYEKVTPLQMIEVTKEDLPEYIEIKDEEEIFGK